MGGSPDGGGVSQTLISQWRINRGLKSKYRMLLIDARRTNEMTKKSRISLKLSRRALKLGEGLGPRRRIT